MGRHRRQWGRRQERQDYQGLQGLQGHLSNLDNWCRGRSWLHNKALKEKL